MASQAALDLVINLKDNASSALGGVAERLGTIGKVAGGVALGGMVAVGGGLAAAATAGFSFNNSMEQTTAKLNAFTKDSAKSAEILEMIRDRASKTPFAFEEMASSAAALLPVSKQSGIALEDLIEKAEILAASNPAEGLEGAAFALKEAASGDFASIIERFNLPRQYLNQLKEEGVPAAQAVSMAMQQMGLDTDLVTGLAETASGRWSTFKDTLTGIAATATGSLFESFSSGLGTVNTALEANMPMLESFAQQIGTGIGAAINTAVGAVGFLITAWQDATEYTAGFAEQIGAVVDRLLGTPTVFQEVGYVLDALRSAFQDAGLFSIEFAESLSLVHPSLQTLWLSLVDVSEQALPIFQQGMAMIGPLIQNVVSVAVPLIAAFVQSWIERFRMILSIVQAVMPSIQSIITSVLAIVGTFMQRHGAEIQQFMVSAWTQIQTIIRLAMEVIRAVVIPAFAAIASFIANHRTEIVTVLEGAWTIIKNVIQGALTLIQGVLRATLQVLQGDWRGAWETIKSTVSSVLENIKGIIQGGVQAFAGIIRAVGPSLSAAGTAIVNMLKSGISNAWGSLTSFFSGKLQELRNLLPFSEPRDAASPLRGLAKAGESILRNVAEGIPKGATILDDKLVSSLKGTADLIESSVKAMTALANFDGSAIHEDTAFNFAEKLGWVVQSIQELAGNFKAKALAAAGEFADSAGKVVGIIGSGVDALTKLAQYNEGSLFEDAVVGFTNDLEWVIYEFGKMAADFDLKAMQHAAAFAESAGKVIGIVGSGVDAITKLGKAEFTAIAGPSLQVFVRNLSLLVIQIEEAAEGFSAEGLIAAGAFAEAAGKVVGAMGSGIDAFVKLQDYDGVAPERIQSVANDMDFAAIKMIEIAAKADVEGVQAAAVFAEALGRVFTLFKTGVDALNALREYQAVPRERMEAVLADFDSALRLMLQVTRGADVEGTSIAAGFAEASKKIFDALKTGVSALDAIREFQAVPEERMQAFFGHMQSVLDLMKRMGGEADQYKKQAESWRDAVKAAADAIKEGISAIGTINTIPGLPTIPGAPEARALGGPVTAQSAYLVGERGPELFVPRSSGTIVPNNQLGAQIQRNGVFIENFHANYAFQDERALRDDLRMLQLLGAA